jgi:hypothetical protein
MCFLCALCPMWCKKTGYKKCAMNQIELSFVFNRYAISFLIYYFFYQPIMATPSREFL